MVRVCCRTATVIAVAGSTMCDWFNARHWRHNAWRFRRASLAIQCVTVLVPVISFAMSGYSSARCWLCNAERLLQTPLSVPQKHTPISLGCLLAPAWAGELRLPRNVSGGSDPPSQPWQLHKPSLLSAMRTYILHVIWLETFSLAIRRSMAWPPLSQECHQPSCTQ